ncbi:BadF/BadG/BcrA/BcrD ATPase family protein [Paracoccus aerodenitrificans]|uniref:BadF/BadG/BcrA/BcrD ATPase family protein n=1 Tax=Paracoccus aerodenitrificans TaxID=3017781 RepID=UPI0022F11D14|nr:BadF/BadG/BcrA/BcrD ATPase family protein [Paracoccus aerodenitrificans]WBU63501.1 ATPase [Paracoccus aerodenitrificans]
MVFFLGIDGGGTGCRAALADAEGRILGRGTGGPANINTSVDAAATSIIAATMQSLENVEASPQDLIATLGLAGGTMSGATRRLAELLPFGRTQIVNDGVIAARGALGSDDGILAAIGTGSVYAVQRGNQIRQSGGRGFLLGDHASGAVMGRELLSRTLMAEDGFVPMTPLLKQISAQLGGIEGIIEFGNTARPADFGALAPRIVNSDDPAAREIFENAVEQVRHALQTLQQDDNLPVVFTGGLGPYYAERLDGPWPLRSSKGSAVDGALDMAIQMGASS